MRSGRGALGWVIWCDPLYHGEEPLLQDVIGTLAAPGIGIPVAAPGIGKILAPLGTKVRVKPLQMLQRKRWLRSPTTPERHLWKFSWVSRSSC